MKRQEEVTMNFSVEKSWVRTGLLLLALAAGGLATLLVPPYRDIAYAADDQEQAMAARPKPGRGSSDMSGIDVDLRHLKYVASIG
jgi:hypothetical protein